MNNGNQCYKLVQREKIRENVQRPENKSGAPNGSVRKALNPLQFSEGNFHLDLRPSVFGLIKMSFGIPKKGQLRFSERK